MDIELSPHECASRNTRSAGGQQRPNVPCNRVTPLRVDLTTSHKAIDMNLQADIIIMDAYHADKGNNCALIAADEILRKLKVRWGEQKVTKRAIALGLTAARRNSLFWTEAEDNFLAENAHLSPPEVHAKFNKQFSGRTLSAIVARVNRLGGARAVRAKAGFSLTELESHLHLSRCTLKHLASSGILAASRPTGRDWFFRKSDVKTFISLHPDHLDWTRIDKFWVIELLTAMPDKETSPDVA